MWWKWRRQPASSRIRRHIFAPALFGCPRFATAKKRRFAAVFASKAGKPPRCEVDNPKSIGYIRALEVEDMAFVGPSLYPNSNPIN
jgi:hypothetical protein